MHKDSVTNNSCPCLYCGLQHNYVYNPCVSTKYQGCAAIDKPLNMYINFFTFFKLTRIYVPLTT